MGASQQAATGGHSTHGKDGTAGRSALAPAITLCPLHPEDPLLHKWQLPAEFPPANEAPLPPHEAAPGSKGGAVADGHLRLSTGHDSGEPWECRVPFTDLAREGGVVLGRCPHTADITLPHESVSRRHALLEIAETGLVITDLSSTNGTRVDEQELSPYDRRVPLFDGTRLLLGAADLRLEYIR